mmetsp:Transcript_10852/g.20093  ORF Transcript_10852/g.20093 Transcript_10852/m.20093 type:complete len:945 (+) Transcript_10852:77-2911(+)
MKFNYQFSNLCGVSHKGGNILFTPDGNALLSAVGNRVTVFDLVGHRARTLPFEARKDIKRMALSNSGRLLIVVDADGFALVVNFVAQTVLHRINLKKKVKAMSFSPNDEYLAITVDRQIQVWQTPSTQKAFAPMVLHRKYTGHHDQVTTVSWSADSRYFVTGSKDNTGKVYSLNTEKDFYVVTLTGHKSPVLGCFMMQNLALPAKVETDVSVYDNSSSAITQLDIGQLDPTSVIYTVSSDGSLIVWRWDWSEEELVVKEEESSSDEDEDGDEDGDEDSTNGNDKDESDRPLSITKGEWVRHARYFLQRDHAQIQSVAMHPSRPDLMVVGFDNGVFSLFEMPTATHIQSLSVSQHELKSAAINCTGEWLALASAKLGQVLVWEWKSETYVLKQQGHFYDVNVAAFSPDGQLIATGGDDSKVKLWNATSGFSFTTFTEHTGPVTALSFIGEGNAVVSASLDGTVRAFDLVRYRNFRTLTTPNPVQFNCLAVDGAGEIVCAGAVNPGDIFMWSLQTGKLLEVLAGHEGPLSGLAFAPMGSELVSTSWDQTMRVWKPYESNSAKEVLSLGSDGLCVAFRPDGKEVCVGTLSGHLQLWDLESGQQTGVIEGLRDVRGGRRKRDLAMSKNSAHGKHFSSVSYTVDGSCVIAGGRSAYVCIFHVKSHVLLKKYKLSHNRSLDGIMDKLNSKNITEAGAADLANVSDDDDSDEDNAALGQALPGASRGEFGKRTTRPEIRCKSIQFSPTGQEWAAATTEGLMIYSLNSDLLFDPFEISEDTTPEKVREIARKGRQGALLQALHLGEGDLIVEIYRSIKPSAVQLVARSIPAIYLKRMFEIVAAQMSDSPEIAHHLNWALALLSAHNDRLRGSSAQFLSAFRTLQKAIARHSKDMSKLCNENMYTLSFLANQKSSQSDEEEEANGFTKPMFRLVRPDVETVEENEAKRAKTSA